VLSKTPWASGGPGEDTGGVLSGAACDAYSPACAKHAEGGVACGPAAEAAAERHLPAGVLLCCFSAVLLRFALCGDYGRLCFVPAVRVLSHLSGSGSGTDLTVTRFGSSSKWKAGPSGKRTATG